MKKVKIKKAISGADTFTVDRLFFSLVNISLPTDNLSEPGYLQHYSRRDWRHRDGPGSEGIKPFF
jgi:hypothetical protein